MPSHTTPHTQTQQNTDPARADLDAGQIVADSGQEEDASLYENMDGAQTGGTRAFNANAERSRRPNTEPREAPTNDSIKTLPPEGTRQGITNHSASEEDARQTKVMSERPDATAGVPQKAR